MIRFQVDNKQYRIEWMNEAYQQLYMFYEPQGKLFQYDGQEIKSISFDRQEFINNNYVLAPLVATATQGVHSKYLPIGKYRCSLYSDRYRRQGPIQSKDIFIGTQIEILMSRQRYRGNFDFLYIESEYKFPVNSICLTFERSLGERIFLPEMTKSSQGKFYTGCILPPEAYDRLTVAVSPGIRDCTLVRKI